MFGLEKLLVQNLKSSHLGPKIVGSSSGTRTSLIAMLYSVLVKWAVSWAVKKNGVHSAWERRQSVCWKFGSENFNYLKSCLFYWCIFIPRKMWKFEFQSRRLLTYFLFYNIEKRQKKHILFIGHFSNKLWHGASLPTILFLNTLYTKCTITKRAGCIWSVLNIFFAGVMFTLAWWVNTE